MKKVHKIIKKRNHVWGLLCNPMIEYNTSNKITCKNCIAILKTIKKNKELEKELEKSQKHIKKLEKIRSKRIK